MQGAGPRVPLAALNGDQIHQRRYCNCRHDGLHPRTSLCRPWPGQHESEDGPQVPESAVDNRPSWRRHRRWGISAGQGAIPTSRAATGCGRPRRGNAAKPVHGTNPHQQPSEGQPGQRRRASSRRGAGPHAPGSSPTSRSPQGEPLWGGVSAGRGTSPSARIAAHRQKSQPAPERRKQGARKHGHRRGRRSHRGQWSCIGASIADDEAAYQAVGHASPRGRRLGTRRQSREWQCPCH